MLVSSRTVFGNQCLTSKKGRLVESATAHKEQPEQPKAGIQEHVEALLVDIMNNVPVNKEEARSLLASMAAHEETTESPAQGFYYIVQRGDTLFRIGQRFGVDWHLIAAANGLQRPYTIYPGQRLFIPVAQPANTPFPPPGPGFFYTVRPGDTLYLLAQRFGTTVDAIAQANNLIPPYTIYTGQVLFIPAAVTPTPTPTAMPTTTVPPGQEGLYYTVRPGDSVFTIARAFGVTTESIIAANNLQPPYTIFPGQRLFIPVPVLTYTVMRGDSVFLIARRFRTTTTAIILANNLQAPYTIFPGQNLIVPLRTPNAPPGGSVYRVAPGDTLFTIAQRFGVTVPAILAINPNITNPNVIYPGEFILIPPPTAP